MMMVLMMMDDDDFIEADDANKDDFLLSQGKYGRPKGLEIQRNVCSGGHDNTILTRLNCVHYIR